MFYEAINQVDLNFLTYKSRRENERDWERRKERERMRDVERGEEMKQRRE